MVGGERDNLLIFGLFELLNGKLRLIIFKLMWPSLVVIINVFFSNVLLWTYSDVGRIFSLFIHKNLLLSYIKVLDTIHSEI